MPLGPVIVILLRLILPLSILRYPLWGGILAMLLDGADVIIAGWLNMGDFSSYHTTDKYLDMYYLTLEVYKSLSWQNALACRTSMFLFIYRFVGVIWFEATNLRILLFVFPNLFENFFLFFEAYRKIKKTEKLSWKGILIALIILLIPKLVQEYLMHVVLLRPWDWFHTTFLKP